LTHFLSVFFELPLELLVLLFEPTGIVDSYSLLLLLMFSESRFFVFEHLLFKVTLTFLPKFHDLSLASILTSFDLVFATFDDALQLWLHALNGSFLEFSNLLFFPFLSLLFFQHRPGLFGVLQLIRELLLLIVENLFEFLLLGDEHF